MRPLRRIADFDSIHSSRWPKTSRNAALQFPPAALTLPCPYAMIQRGVSSADPEFSVHLATFDDRRLVMFLSAAFAVYLTWSATGR